MHPSGVGMSCAFVHPGKTLMWGRRSQIKGFAVFAQVAGEVSFAGFPERIT
jgi:hypothetical protein